MKKNILIYLLTTLPGIFYASSNDVYTRLQNFDDKVTYVCEDGFDLKISTNIFYALARYHLQEGCKNNECKVTDEKSIKLLQEDELVDAEGNIKEGVCEALERIEEGLIKRIIQKDFKSFGHYGSYYDSDEKLII